MRARLHALDTLRAFLMLLGVVYHAVQFSLTGHGLTGRAPAYDAFIFFVHTWRMPAFFFLSGFFAELLAERRGPAAALRNRLSRVGLPLLLALLTILPLNIFFISAYVDASQSGRPDVLSLNFFAEALAHRWRKPKIHHLWFLYYLLSFCLVYFAARPLAGRTRLSSGATAVLAYGAAFLALLAMPSALNVSAPDGILLRPPEFIFYFAFFVAGAGAFPAYRGHGELKLPPLVVSGAVALAGYAGILLVWILGADPLPSLPLRALYAALKIATVWGSVTWLTEAFRRHAGRESAAVRFLVFASFWTYLLHEPLLNAFGVLLASYRWPMPAEIGATAGLTYLACLLSYRYLVRGTWLDGILNGPGKAP